MSNRVLFEDRSDAGRQLARLLRHYQQENPVVLALPRGGVVVGYEIARTLGAPLDVVVARKLGAPMQPELGIGAIAPGGIMLLDERTVRLLGLSAHDVERVAAQEGAEMERRLHRYRGGDGLPDVKGRTAILVDDGLATGVTAMAAIRAVRQLQPRQIVLAVPVCARETAAIQQEVDDFVCMACPEHFIAVGAWYRHFDQTTDEEVIELLEEARAHVSTRSLHEPQ